MADRIIPRDFFRTHVLAPSILDEMEELFPTTILPSTNILKGLAISEDDKNVYVEAAVPGIDPKEIDVTYDNGVLTVRAEKKEEEKGKTYQRRATRSFFYQVSPRDVDPKAEPDVTCKNGMVKVSFAKTSKIKAKKLTVKSS